MRDNDLTKYIDPSVNPADDFYAYAAARWADENPIPADKSNWGAFERLRQDNLERLHALLQDLSAKEDVQDGSDEQKVRDLFCGGMDMDRREREGMRPIEPLLERIRGMQSLDDLASVLAFLHRRGVSVFWDIHPQQDLKQSDRVILYTEQSGLSLPDRDDYLKDDEKTAAMRAAFRRYMEHMLGLAGMPHHYADPVMMIETRLARASLNRTDRRSKIEEQYNKMPRTDISHLAPSFAWEAYFAEVGVDTDMAEDIVVSQPDFIRECEAVMSGMPLEDIKAYLLWHVANGAARFLAPSWEEARFAFYGKELRGAEEMPPAWERVLHVVDGLLEQALGRAYVERYFPPEAKDRANELVDDLMAVFRERIAALDWMSEETKRDAYAKLDAMTRKIGYPDEWRDYSALTISWDASYVENVLAASLFEFDRQMQKIGKPVDRSEWIMPPQMVNACYHPLLNQILFPAAILQPPFFNHEADDAVNYGAIGMVIGHEMTHGFDDNGRKFDKNGNLAEWWSDEDRERFMARAQLVVDQFNACEVIDGLTVNGEYTLGENIADLGGVAIAYGALQRSFERKGRPEPEGGFTPEQRFFLSLARIWRENVRTEERRRRLIEDPHSPPYLRVVMPLSNFAPFYEAFGADDGTAMYRPPEARAAIW